MMSSIMEKGDLVIAISHSGETEEIIKTVELAKENGVSIISITENKESELKEISDINLSYISGETVLETGSISSKLAQIFLIDTVYTQVVKADFNKSLNTKIKTTNAIKLSKEIGVKI